MNILMITGAKDLSPARLSREWDKIIIDKKVFIQKETYELLRTRLNRQNPDAKIIIGDITLL